MHRDVASSRTSTSNIAGTTRFGGTRFRPIGFDVGAVDQHAGERRAAGSASFQRPRASRSSSPSAKSSSRTMPLKVAPLASVLGTASSAGGRSASSPAERRRDRLRVVFRVLVGAVDRCERRSRRRRRRTGSSPCTRPRCAPCRARSRECPCRSRGLRAACRGASAPSRSGCGTAASGRCSAVGSSSPLPVAQISPLEVERRVHLRTAAPSVPPAPAIPVDCASS